MATTFTQGQIGVTPLTLRTSLELARLRDVLAELRYTGDVIKPGWGNIEDGDERLGKRLRVRPAGGTPVHVAEPRLGPERVEARFYYDRYDASLAKQVDGDIDSEYLYTSDALDVIFTPNDAGFDLLASSGNAYTVSRHLLSSLYSLRQYDPELDANIGRSQGPLDPGIQLWLLHRFNGGSRQLTPQITLEDLRAVAVVDSADRQVRILRECVISRPTLQAAITENGAKFGAIKLAVWDDIHAVTVDFELRPDGGFSVTRGRSEYDASEDVTHLDFGRKIVDDLAFSIIPRIEAAYADDSKWHSKRRAKFLRDVRKMFQAAPASRQKKARKAVTRSAP